jgi:PEP-CTERM motif-containing protein
VRFPSLLRKLSRIKRKVLRISPKKRLGFSSAELSKTLIMRGILYLNPFHLHGALWQPDCDQKMPPQIGRSERCVMRRTLVLVLGILIAGLLGAGTASADQVFVCQSCSSPPGGAPNVITDTSSFNVGLAGSGTDDSPLLIIVAVYNGVGSPSISFGGNPSEPLATAGTYGLLTNSTTLTTGQDVFAVLGLTAGGSESLGNLSGHDTTLGFAAPTSFTLDVFEIPTNLTGTITIDESGASGGSFILAYSCKSGTPTDAKCPNGDVSQTVDTNMGFIKTPEPGSLALLCTGLLAMAGGLRRRSVKS